MNTTPGPAGPLFRTGTLVATATVAAFLCLVLSVTQAPAASYFSPVQALSADGQNAFYPQVAVDSSGRATVAWPRSDDSSHSIQSVHLAADGTPGAVHVLSDAATADGQTPIPDIAIDSSGRATIVWTRTDGSETRVQSVRLESDGTPGTVQTLSAAGQHAHSPKVAIDSSDRATIVWFRSDGLNTRVQSVRLAADGTPGAVQTLSLVGKDARQPRVAIDSSDRATIVWTGKVGSDWRIETVRLAADGTPGVVQTLSGTDPGYGEALVFAIDSSGRATIVWGGDDGLNLRIKSVRLAADGTPGAVQTLSEAGGPVLMPDVAIDISGRATITWWHLLPDFSDRIEAVRLAADGTPGAVQTLSASGQYTCCSKVAIDSSGRATVVWERPGTGIQLVRLAADGTPGAVQTVSEDGGTYPQIAVDGSDRATITWSGSGGGFWRTQSTRVEIGAPDTTITSGPDGRTRDSSPSFSFSSEEPGATFECRLNSGPFAPCISPRSFSDLADGSHTFVVRAADDEGGPDLTPATRDFTVDTSPRRARISKVRVSGPKKAKKGKKATYRVKITNSGNAQATGVRVRVSGKGLRAKKSVGKIPAGKARVVKLKLKPKGLGKIKASFKVTSKNAGKRTARKTITVRRS